MANVFHLMNPSLRNLPRVKLVTKVTRGMAPWALVARQHPHHTETLLDWAVKTGVTRLVVWGGDGTFHRVVRGLHERGVLDKIELGLVPMGTCNDLARRLGLSWECWGRWETQSPQGRLAALSLGRMSWRAQADAPQPDGSDVFINNAGFGRPRTSYKRKDSPWRVLRSFKSLGVTVRWGDGHLTARAYFGLAALGPYFSGGLHFEKDLSPEDGVLRFYLVPARSKIRLALRLARGRLGAPLFDEKVTKISAPRLSVESESPLWPQADGEPPAAKAARRVDFELLTPRAKLWVTH
ncbi:MAG TPA: diacylglycerol kinase family protein [Elusimicrobiota bacterium]|nr:diacylglycerol kinase family protein [Elusimicrobiota bacterium]HMX42142.1 diacylglycerol kinase family protein [Elusimicrobiota bacterium]HMX94769.1 diacylglycerol kinase family protein [Elusimicrobiota bacterium]HMZ25766.1 diacylglycerol kinase family protein [Elusimicrobiota bacterium]HNA59764.1 diacylglycerol kinase family protein [Elusimicrobiota bacterium]